MNSADFIVTSTYQAGPALHGRMLRTRQPRRDKGCEVPPSTALHDAIHPPIEPFCAGDCWA